MCDYSLHNVASRPAKVGDKLITSSFRGTITHGFASVDDPNVAVCLRPGTEIAFDEEIRHESFWRTKRSGHKTAIFRQLNMDRPVAFHDALEFFDGKLMLLTRLREGQRATVLQLPADQHVVRPVEENRAQEQRRVSIIG